MEIWNCDHTNVITFYEQIFNYLRQIFSYVLGLVNTVLFQLIITNVRTKFEPNTGWMVRVYIFTYNLSVLSSWRFREVSPCFGWLQIRQDESSLIRTRRPLKLNVSILTNYVKIFFRIQVFIIFDTSYILFSQSQNYFDECV